MPHPLSTLLPIFLTPSFPPLLTHHFSPPSPFLSPSLSPTPSSPLPCYPSPFLSLSFPLSLSIPPPLSLSFPLSLSIPHSLHFSLTLFFWVSSVSVSCSLSIFSNPSLQFARHTRIKRSLEVEVQREGGREGGREIKRKKKERCGWTVVQTGKCFTYNHKNQF